MVITRFTGGLGNQMFQYAAGRAAALRNQTSLVLNTGFFEETPNKQAHEQEVHIELFPAIKAQHLARISGSELRKLEAQSHSFIRRNYDRVRNKLGLPVFFKTVSESNLLHYQPDFKRHRAKIIYMASDWQNENYFIDYEDIIRNDFAFPPLTSNSLNASLLASMQESQSIAVHVRRGDYLTSPTHRPLTAEYYLEALALIHTEVKSPTFFVFSDDITWCQQQLNLPGAHYVTHNTGQASHLDLQLMSHCKHNIIANSSFSWWGAWLNTNPYKLVIAPKMWLEKYQIQSSNIVPQSWIII